jgi:DNA-directed RNA polymerase specialized sigma24 family protein
MTIPSPMTAAEPTETEYMRFRTGTDDRAVSRVFRYWYGRLVGYVESTYGLDTDEAKDRAQLAFVAILREGIPPHVSVPSGLFMFARRYALEFVRTRKRRRNLLRLRRGDLTQPTPQPDAIVGAAMAFDAVLEMIEHTTEVHYQAFLLRRVEGWAYGDIGTLLGMSESNAANAVQKVDRAIRRARPALVEQLPDALPTLDLPAAKPKRRESCDPFVRIRQVLAETPPATLVMPEPVRPYPPPPRPRPAGPSTRTHCGYGHAWQTNSFTDRKGCRRCRACSRDHATHHRAKLAYQRDLAAYERGMAIYRQQLREREAEAAS